MSNIFRIIKYNTDNYNAIHTFKNKTLKNNNKNVKVGLIGLKFCFIYSYSFN